MDVPDSVLYRSTAADCPHNATESHHGHVDAIVVPGAKISTQEPKFVKDGSPSLDIEAATEIVPSVPAGVMPHAEPPSLPDAATTTTPSASRLLIAVSILVAVLSKPMLILTTAFSPAL